MSKNRNLEDQIKQLNQKGAKKSKLAQFMQQQSEKYNIPVKQQVIKETKPSKFQNQY